MSNVKKLIIWCNRYSETMEDDNMGRWARIAYSGDFYGEVFRNGKPTTHQIAWVDKLKIKDEIRFCVSYKFPSNEKHVFKTIAQAKRAVSINFRFFLENTLKSVGINF